MKNNVVRVNFHQKKKVEHFSNFWYDMKIVGITLVIIAVGLIYLLMCVAVLLGL